MLGHARSLWACVRHDYLLGYEQELIEEGEPCAKSVKKGELR